jgi:hypothetical protein
MFEGTPYIYTCTGIPIDTPLMSNPESKRTMTPAMRMIEVHDTLHPCSAMENHTG